MTKIKESKPRVLNQLDRCDRCNAQAFILVKLISGELMFCGHHFNEHELALRTASYEIVDERETIDFKAELEIGRAHV